MPAFGFGLNCEDPACPNGLDPHCHSGAIDGAKSPTIHSSRSPIPETHKPSTERQMILDPAARSEEWQPSLVAGSGVDLSRIPGCTATSRGTFSFPPRQIRPELSLTPTITARAGNLDLNHGAGEEVNTKQQQPAMAQTRSPENLRHHNHQAPLKTGRLQRHSGTVNPREEVQSGELLAVEPEERRGGNATQSQEMSANDKGENINIPEAERNETTKQNTTIEIADPMREFEPPARVFTGDSAFDSGEGGENSGSGFRPPARVSTWDSAFYSDGSGENSRSQSRTRAGVSLDRECD